MTRLLILESNFNEKHVKKIDVWETATRALTTCVLERAHCGLHAWETHFCSPKRSAGNMRLPALSAPSSPSLFSTFLNPKKRSAVTSDSGTKSAGQANNAAQEPLADSAPKSTDCSVISPVTKTTAKSNSVSQGSLSLSLFLMRALETDFSMV